MATIKILHVISSLYRGGRERQLATIFKYTDKVKYPTKVLIFNKTNQSYIEEYAIGDKDIFYLNARKPIKRLAEIKRIVKAYKPDIVYSWGGLESSFCMIALKGTKSRLINGSIRHGKVIFNFKHSSRLIGLHLSRFIVANSQAGLRVNRIKNRGFVLYNGIDDKFIRQTELTEKIAKRKLLIPDYKDEVIISSVANLIPYKDYFTILEVLGLVNKKGYRIRYFIIGDGPLRKEIEDKIEELNLTKEVILLGKISNVQDYLQMSDLFIHSSLGEGCSNAVLEAMAAGLPVIASDTGGTTEIVSEKNGFLFEYKNTGQLAESLEILLNDAEIREEKANASFEIINEEFTIQKMIKNYYQILSEVMQNKTK